MSDISLPLPINLSESAQRTIKRALNLLEKHLRQPGIAFTSATAARDWVTLKLAGLEREVFMALYLDNQHRLIEYETLFMGSINHTEVQPREIVKAALRHNSAAVILVHNHPSGETEPSKADRFITERVKKSLELVDIRTLDHLIVGHGNVVSFAECGWL